jgi:transposase
MHLSAEMVMPPSKNQGGPMRSITLVGIDLAKEVFELNGVDKDGRTVFRRTLKRSELVEFMANLPACRVVTEACGGSHYWGRLFASQGHEAKLIAAQFVKPFKQSRQKNDSVDAQAIVEAASRPKMKYVSVKNLYQQDLQSLHRVRQQLVQIRTQISNQIRGLLMEYGVVLDEGVAQFKKQFHEAIESENELTPTVREVTRSMYELFERVSLEQDQIEEKLKAYVKSNDDIKRLMAVPGVGFLTASLFLASVGNPTVFKNGRHLAAWLGVVPRQNSSGGKERLGMITKTGDCALRTMLIQGARSAMIAAVRKQKTDPLSEWILKLKQKKGWNRTAVALANRNARVMWHLVRYKENYKTA